MNKAELTHCVEKQFIHKVGELIEEAKPPKARPEADSGKP